MLEGILFRLQNLQNIKTEYVNCIYLLCCHVGTQFRSITSTWLVGMQNSAVCIIIFLFRCLQTMIRQNVFMYLPYFHSALLKCVILSADKCMSLPFYVKLHNCLFCCEIIRPFAFSRFQNNFNCVICWQRFTYSTMLLIINNNAGQIQHIMLPAINMI